jgi:cell division protein FtsA
MKNRKELKTQTKYIVAIDFGTTKIVTVVGEKYDTGEYKIIAFDETPSTGIKHGQIENVESVIKALNPSLEKIENTLDINIRKVYVGIAGLQIGCYEKDTYKNREKYDEIIGISDAMELEADVIEAHKDNNSEILQIIPLYYIIDDRTDIVKPVGCLGNKLTGYFYVITMPRTIRIHTNVCMTKLNLSLNKLFLESIASAKATLVEDEKEMGIVLIDMGGGTTDIVIYYEHRIVHTAVVPLGGDDITDALRKECNILFDQAEQIKKRFGLSLSDKDQRKIEVEGIIGYQPRYIKAQIIRKTIIDAFSNIVNRVIEEINKAKCPNLNLGIVLTGGVAEMTGIEEFMSAKTGMEIKIGIPCNIINEPNDRIFQPQFSTAVGLIMCGFEDLETGVDNHSTVEPRNVTKWLKKTWTDFVNPQIEETDN